MKLKHDPTHHKVLTVADPLRATVDQPGFSTLVHDLHDSVLLDAQQPARDKNVPTKIPT